MRVTFDKLDAFAVEHFPHRVVAVGHRPQHGNPRALISNALPPLGVTFEVNFQPAQQWCIDILGPSALRSMDHCTLDSDIDLDSAYRWLNVYESFYFRVEEEALAFNLMTGENVG